MASGAVLLIFSFLAFYKVDGGDGFDGESWSAWSNAFSLFPLSTLIVLAGVALAAEVAVRRFANASLPDGFGGFTFSQLRLIVGALGTLTLFGYLIRSFGADAEIDKGIGLILAFLAMIGLTVSAVMERQANGAVPAATAADTAARRQPTPADWLIIGGGVVILVGSFLKVYGFESVFDDTETRSAWGDILFPLYVIPVLLGVLMAAQVAATTFADVRLPDRILGIAWREIHLAFGIWAALMMVCFLIGSVLFSIEGEDFADVERGIGFWLMLVAALALAAGAVMRRQEGNRPAAPSPPAQAPPPPPPPA